MFLNWLAETIQQHEIDALLVAGDVFDSSAPSNRAQELYYRFLHRIATSSCQHIVVVAGNHDSPTFLNAPKALLRALNVHVIGSMTDTLEEELIVLEAMNPQEGEEIDAAIICAVPYLRDRDVRRVEPGEAPSDKTQKLVEGIQAHYASIVALAEEKRSDLKKTFNLEKQDIPIIAMGHLFMDGGKTIDGDGSRDLYVGSLGQVGEEAFPASIDYLALGHLHVPQIVGTRDHFRYSGSPIPMSFGEATQEKSVVIIEFNSNKIPEKQSANDANERRPTEETICENQRNLGMTISLKKVPCFQQLVRIEGGLDEILATVENLKKEESKAWLEIDYTGTEIVGDLRERFEEAVAGSAMEILLIKNRSVTDRVIKAMNEGETLADLDANDVFTRCLETYAVPDADREELMVTYHEIVKDLLEMDVNAE